MRTFLRKTGIFFLGIIFTLIILEIGVRIFGYFYTFQHKNNQIKSKSNYSILCIGDSFTYGIGSSEGFDYPSQLEGLLNSYTNKTFKVYNRGLPNNNTTAILSKLQEQVDLFKPDLIIYLGGGANERDFWGYGSKLKNILYEFKTLRLLHLLKLNLLNKSLIIKKEKNEYFEKAKIEQNYGKINRATSENYLSDGYKSALFKSLIILRKKDKTSDDCYKTGIFFLRKSDYNLAIYLFEKGIEIDKYDYKNYEGLSFTFNRLKLFKKSEICLNEGLKFCKNNQFLLCDEGDIYIIEKKISESVNILNKAVRVSNKCGTCYYILQKAKSLSNDLNQKSLIDNTIKNFPIDSSTYFFDYFDKYHFYNYSNTNYFLSNKLSDKTELFNWINSDLIKIINLCKNERIKLIIQNYPVAPHIRLMKDKTFTDPEFNYAIAKQFNVPYVNNNKIFSLTGENAKYYFESPDYGEHPNNKGYELMAKNVFDVIVKNRIFDK